MIGAAVLEIITLVGCFWKADGRAFREEHPQTTEQDKSSPQISPVDGSPVETGFMNKFKSKKSKSKKSSSRTKEALTNKVTWL